MYVGFLHHISQYNKCSWEKLSISTGTLITGTNSAPLRSSFRTWKPSKLFPFAKASTCAIWRFHIEASHAQSAQLKRKQTKKKVCYDMLWYVFGTIWNLASGMRIEIFGQICYICWSKCLSTPIRIMTTEPTVPARSAGFSHRFILCYYCYTWLVGGWTTHLKNMLVKMGIFPNPRGENKKYLKAPSTVDGGFVLKSTSLKHPDAQHPCFKQKTAPFL